MRRLYSKKHTLKLITSLAVAVAALLSASQASAFDLSAYAGNSRLASGRWVKISIKTDGVYLLTNAQLRRMGFSDPSKVHVYGYGGRRLPDMLSASTFVDDLPVVQTMRTDRGIIFYGEGVTEPEYYASRYYRPKQNPFTAEGYYFISDVEADDREIPAEGRAAADSPETTFSDYLFHEKELTMLTDTGHQAAGEDFAYTPSRTFNFALTDKVDGTDVRMVTSFMAITADVTSISFTANGTELPNSASDNIPSTSASDHGNYSTAVTSKTFGVDGDKLALGVTFNRAGTVSAANLDYIAINYTRRLRLPSGWLRFTLSRTQAALDNATASTVVWDVTKPLDISAMNASLEGSSLKWTNDYTGRRNYVAFDSSAALPEPTYVGVVANQNLHALEVPDMVIFTPAAWLSHAKRLADFHKTNDGLDVIVVDQNEVFNEFASGSRDVNAFRKMLKMLYDRSAASDKKLKYALFMGRGSFDNRRLTTPVASLRYELMPLWQSDKGESDTSSFTTDDIFAFLEDNSGNNMSADYYCIGVGRMPVTSVGEAKLAVDKVIKYSTDMPSGTWRNRTLLLADDQDMGKHMEQMEEVWETMLGNGGENATHTKLYTDEYQLTGGEYPQAREAMFKTLDEGVLWWYYIGHANTVSLTHEGLLKLHDISGMYLRRWPIFFAATCEFLRWDANSTSAGELMWLHEDGGCIAQISANRPVYIPENLHMSRGLARNIFGTDENGRRLTLGEIYRRGKNDAKYVGNGVVVANSNKLRYILMGDPAMYPAMPEQYAVVDRINGVDPSGEEQAIVMARQDVIVEGRIVDADGNTMTGYNGTVASTLYDADRSITTRGNSSKDSEGKPITFDQHGDRLFAGTDSVKGGAFSLHIAMPSEVADNFREATLSMVARENNGTTFRDYAAGVNRSFYVYGTDESVVDTIPPVIRSMFINHPSFRDGDMVNSTPMLIAEISDNHGINMNTTGIGHQMHILVDGKRSYSDVAEFYTPAADGSISGTIAYQLSNLPEGEHTLRLRVWDTSDNSTSQTISFYVSPDKAPTVYDVYSDANPASVEANFYLSHDRPDSQLEVTVTVYNMLGHPVWESVTSGRSDMYLSSPVKWDLRNNAGQRVNRGIYLYRASIKENGVVSNTTTKRIAVTGN